jgi:putative tryptophan/tyrosine transport system substrate-binding protein
MRRREFIARLGSVAVWPLTARAQQGERVRRVAVLLGGTASDPTNQAMLAALRDRLLQLGWSESGNIRFESRFGEGDLARGRLYAAELVGLNPDVILSDNTPLVQELQKQTHAIPIVFASVADPVATGVVARLSRPGGNATGFMNPEPAISGRWLELLKQVAPNLARVLVLVNAENVGNQARFRVIEAAAPSLGVQVSAAAIRVTADVENAIHTALGEPGLGLIIAPGPPLSDFRKLIPKLAVEHRLPTIYPYRKYVAEGGLMSYGAEPPPMWAQAATYVDRILRGEKPSNLPVQLPTKFELAINLKTAKTLGLEIPPNLLALADEVIE